MRKLKCWKCGKNLNKQIECEVELRVLEHILSMIPEQKEIHKKLKELRKKNWDEAFKEAKGNIAEALNILMKKDGVK